MAKQNNIKNPNIEATYNFCVVFLNKVTTNKKMVPIPKNEYNNKSFYF